MIHFYNQYNIIWSVLWLWAPNEWCLIFLCTTIWVQEIRRRLRIIIAGTAAILQHVLQSQSTCDCDVTGGQGTGAHHFLSRKHGWGSWACSKLAAILSACDRNDLSVTVQSGDSGHFMMIQNPDDCDFDNWWFWSLDIMNRTEPANLGNTMVMWV